MGCVGDYFVRILNVFVYLFIFNVNFIEVIELYMLFSDIEIYEWVSVVCQGFVGFGVQGEVLCILSDFSLGDVVKILNILGDVDDQK